jgi:hypothetical protein
VASLSLDLDNLWSYLKTHGDGTWRELPTYLDRVVPIVLAFLRERDLRITFFVVGEDAARPENHDAIAALAAAGHEIANHSFRHEPWLHLYPEAELDEEMARTEAAIEAITGQRPRGFRGPGFSLSDTTLGVLARRGYHYDASTLPTWIGPLARAYYFATADLTEEDRRKRDRLFGVIGDARRPLGPYRWRLGSASLIEIPVTTMPLARIPFHVSYVLYLGTRSPGLARRYFDLALALCRRRGVSPSLLLHPLDFLGGDEIPELAFFPAMRETGASKRRRAIELLDRYRERYRVVAMDDHVASVAGSPLPEREPDLGGR